MSRPLDPARVQAVLFDLDGNLADTDDEYIRRAGQFVRRLDFIFPQRDPTHFLRWSLMLSESPLNLLMGIPDWLGIDGPLARLADRIADHAGPQTSANFVLMAGVDHLLARLAMRYPLALVTARGARETRHFLDQFKLTPHFRAVASAQTAPHTKPYPDPVLWAARELGVPVENCLMVGDTTVDILAGRRAGAQTVGVLCGFGELHELERTGANAILDHTAHLDRLLLLTSDTCPQPPVGV
jgi:phosphoglycolate phosphatase-like HAD superfamily hydrolase